MSKSIKTVLASVASLTISSFGFALPTIAHAEDGPYPIQCDNFHYEEDSILPVDYGCYSYDNSSIKCYEYLDMWDCYGPGDFQENPPQGSGFDWFTC
ncbi:MAG: hypothetical protein JWM33_2611 [Caulobacteraceae bacterium]|nr:hypothetical protein [Caulobacteraceae bacterium]